MVNILLVSHSKKLADSVAEMALQMIGSGSVKIATAARIGEGNQDFGTNAVEIAEAIQNIFTEAGVLILMDLGSAVLSSQMALDLIPLEMKTKVRICPAPLIEGAVVAAAQASSGSDLDSIYREAMDAIKPKEEQLEVSNEKIQEEIPIESQPSADISKKEIILTMQNEHGLHARPGVRFVQTASNFDADIMVKNLTTGKGPSSAKSLTAVTLLGVLNSHQIKITAEGKQRDEALQALADLIESRFGER